MRIGAGLDFKYANPDEWIMDIKTLEVSTVVSPMNECAVTFRVTA